MGDRRNIPRARHLMDPVANIKRQIELCWDLDALKDSDGEMWEETDPMTLVHVAHLACELAELVLVLDGWRQRGGADVVTV